MNKNALLAIAAIFLCNILFTQNSNTYSDLILEAENLYEKGEYLESGQKYAEAFQNYDTGDLAFVNRYYAARSWALANESDSAFVQLFIFEEELFSPHILRTAAISNILAFNEHILTDTNLNSLNSDPRWEEFIDTIEENKVHLEETMDMQLVMLLETVYNNDQVFRDQISEIEQEYGYKSAEMESILVRMRAQDSLNLIIIEKILNERGWLGPDIIGSTGSSALFAVIQHSPPEVLEKYLPMMQEAAKKGDARTDQLALAEDRNNMYHKRKQVYGSQFSTDSVTGESFVWYLVDPDNVDKRRAEVGLNPMREYVSDSGGTWDLEAHKKRLAEFEEKVKQKNSYKP